MIVEAAGGPLGAVVAGANVPDCKLLEQTIDAIVIERPEPTEKSPQHLCLDKGYDNPTGRTAAASRGPLGQPAIPQTNADPVRPTLQLQD